MYFKHKIAAVATVALALPPSPVKHKKKTKKQRPSVNRGGPHVDFVSHVFLERLSKFEEEKTPKFHFHVFPLLSAEAAAAVGRSAD